MAVGSGFTFALSEAIALRTHYPGSYKTGCAVYKFYILPWVYSRVVSVSRFHPAGGGFDTTAGQPLCVWFSHWVFPHM